MLKRKPKPPPLVLTIGHSTRSWDDFLALLRSHEVQELIDVRKLPGSTAYPQFNQDALADALKKAGIDYVHIPELGGRRRPSVDSPNGGWHNRSFQGYADYMQTDAFERAIADLVKRAARRRVALMCAEAVPWRCHRSLIADALLAHGLSVEHILSLTRRQTHTLRSFAHVEGERVTYPPEAESASE